MHELCKYMVVHCPNRQATVSRTALSGCGSRSALHMHTAKTHMAATCSHKSCPFHSQTQASRSSSLGQSNILVKPIAVSVQSTTCCCTATRTGERGLEVVPDLPDLGLLVSSAKSGKGSSLGMASTANHNTSASPKEGISHDDNNNNDKDNR